ncbi:MarR family winged helix-turn-helix transcriptional regulator [uncultured Friedmanniella sp.]|uniref:MarR family winged helix-turn-helix transcriptional regulator n=1 Tax=uncultured Friedmanniella sp. TaxID=335381 RepID=UPI0035CBB70E
MAEIDQTAIRSLRSLILAGERYRQTVAEQTGLGITETQAISSLITYGDRGQHELAVDLGLSSGASTALVDRLERQGIAERYPHPTDRRRTLVRLTEQGLDVVRRSGDWLAAALRDVVPPSEMGRLAETLTTIAEQLNQESSRLAAKEDVSREA